MTEQEKDPEVADAIPSPEEQAALVRIDQIRTEIAQCTRDLDLLTVETESVDTGRTGLHDIRDDCHINPFTGKSWASAPSETYITESPVFADEKVSIPENVKKVAAAKSRIEALNTELCYMADNHSSKQVRLEASDLLGKRREDIIMGELYRGAMTRGELDEITAIRIRERDRKRCLADQSRVRTWLGQHPSIAGMFR
ncbi:hypothetical protein KKF55_06315 [Patescibacteria group bacterium]|nr:hypothetical protein [Patescibacteria group bacterium]